jgi:hypothetical protein
MGIVANAVSHSGDIETKYRVLIVTDKLLTGATAKMNETGGGLYNLLLKQFVYLFRTRVKTQYGNILWLHENNEITTGLVLQKAEAPQQQSEIKHILRKPFFEDLLTWLDLNRTPIIDPKCSRKIKEYATILHQVYHKTYASQELQINFTWSKESVYYLISKIAETRSALSMEYIIRCDVIRIKGDKFSSSACRKGKLNFEKKNQPLKKVIDENFAEETDRSKR